MKLMIFFVAVMVVALSVAMRDEFVETRSLITQTKPQSYSISLTDGQVLYSGIKEITDTLWLTDYPAPIEMKYVTKIKAE